MLRYHTTSSSMTGERRIPMLAVRVLSCKLPYSVLEGSSGGSHLLSVVTTYFCVW